MSVIDKDFFETPLSFKRKDGMFYDEENDVSFETNIDEEEQQQEPTYREQIRMIEFGIIAREKMAERMFRQKHF